MPPTHVCSSTAALHFVAGAVEALSCCKATILNEQMILQPETGWVALQ